MPLDDAYLAACIETLDRHLEEHYGIPVIVRDIPDPLTGDLDGASIHIDHALTPQDHLFLIAHLFGHTVQWNVSPRAREIGQNLPVPVDEALLPEIAEYEREAAGYALSLFHAQGIDDLDQWLSDYTACDSRYLMHYYRTGEKKAFGSFWRDNEPLIAPRPIPPFRPSRWIARTDGIVI